MIEDFGMQNENIRRIFFKEKFKLEEEDIEKWVKASDGFSFAALSEMVAGIKCLGYEFKEVVDRLKEMKSIKVSSSEFEGTTMGFTPVEEE